MMVFNASRVCCIRALSYVCVWDLFMIVFVWTYNKVIALTPQRCGCVAMSLVTSHPPCYDDEENVFVKHRKCKNKKKKIAMFSQNDRLM